MELGAAQLRLTKLKVSPKDAKRNDSERKMVVGLRISKAEKINIGGDSEIGVQPLKVVLGESSTQNNYPKKP